jgi:competence protein ComEA
MALVWAIVAATWVALGVSVAAQRAGSAVEVVNRGTPLASFDDTLVVQSNVVAESGGPQAATPAVRPTGCVNVNTATVDQLDALPGVGPAIAQRIVDRRSAVGPFRSIADLDAVKGLGPSKLTRLQGHICF